MAKIAVIRFKWTRSASPLDAVGRVEVALTVNGNTTTVEVPKEAEEYVSEVRASSSVQFRVDTYDADDDQAVVSSEVHRFQLGNLEGVLPATNVSHEIIEVRDEDAPPPPEPVTSRGR